MQANWIGRSEGARLTFLLEPPEQQLRGQSRSTPRGRTRCSACRSWRWRRSIRWPPRWRRAIRRPRRSSPNAAAWAPARRRSRRRRSTATTPGCACGTRSSQDATFPVWIANFVLMEYGTGAIFGCPAHDQRDLEFARKYGLRVVPVVLPPGADPATFDDRRRGLCRAGHASSIRASSTGWTSKRRSARRSRNWNGCGVGHGEVNWRLRDWGVSRQRYWGCPIPVIHCDACGVVPVPDDQLPVKLPDDVTFDRPGNPLDHHPTWKHVACPRCGAPARRETDTFDTFVDSSWYFARFCSPQARRAGDARGGRSLDAGRPVYRRHRARDPASAVFALLHPRDEADRASGRGGAVRRPVHPGHGDARELSQRRAERHVAVSGGGGEAAGRQRHASRDRRAGRRSAASRR